MTNDILFKVLEGAHGNIGLITLNRPNALNAINLDMTLALIQQLKDWSTDKTIVAVLIKGEGRAFCAGGDLKQLHAIGSENPTLAGQFFKYEYRLNEAISTLKKPYIAWCHGITMGGGVGVGFHASHVIITPSTLFAMPETQIGFFPDVGARYLLHRCPGEIGMYLALTGNSLRADDILYCKLAGTQLPDDSLDLFLNTCLSTFTHDNQGAVLDAYFNQHHLPEKTAPLATVQNEINSLFGHPTLEEIFDALQASNTPFAQACLKRLNDNSPSSLHLVFDLMHYTRNDTLHDILQGDLAAALARVHHPDVYEGIRAQVIDKDKTPHWQAL